MAEVDVAAIREALAKATPGPWVVGDGNEAIAFTHPMAAEDGDLRERVSASSWIVDERETACNAELIVLLRNNAEVLLDEIERLRRDRSHPYG